MSEREKDLKLAKIFKWTARVWSLPAILFVLAHLIGPDEGQGVQEGWLTMTSVAVLMLSAAGLLVAWWKERIGGWASIAAMVMFFVLYWVDRRAFFPLQGAVLVLVGVAVPAGLFILSHSFKKGTI